MYALKGRFLFLFDSYNDHPSVALKITLSLTAVNILPKYVISTSYFMLLSDSDVDIV